MIPQTLKIRDGGCGLGAEFILDGKPINDVISYKVEGAVGQMTLFTVTVFVGEADIEADGEVMDVEGLRKTQA